jgi:hypothetical protein
MELIQQLVSTLGVQENQATGGVGLILKHAQEKLSGADFASIAQQIPGADDMVKSAPEIGGLGGALGSLGSALGGKAEALGGLASLAGGFSKLGLDSGMVGKFIPIILSFVQSKGGDQLKGLLAGVLK